MWPLLDHRRQMSMIFEIVTNRINQLLCQTGSTTVLHHRLELPESIQGVHIVEEYIHQQGQQHVLVLNRPITPSFRWYKELHHICLATMLVLL